MTSVAVVTDHIDDQQQQMLTDTVNRCGAPVRLLAQEDLLDVHSRSIALVICGLAAGERTLPAEVERFWEMGVERPPPIIMLAGEPLIEPVISLSDEQIIVVDPHLSGDDFASLITRLLGRHPLAFSVVQDDEGEIQSDHGSNNWWISCRRQAGDVESWPWARVHGDNAISCGLSEDRLVTLDRVSEGEWPNECMTYEPESRSITLGPLPEGVDCWLLNAKRWPSCQLMNGGPLASQKSEFTTVSGDVVVLARGSGLIHNDPPMIGAEAIQAVRQRCNERRQASVLLEIR